MQKIMFNDRYELTKAVLEGRKTQTRKICKYSRPNESYDIVFPVFEPKDYDNEGNNTSALNYAFGWRNDECMFTGWNKPHYKVGEIVAIAQSYKNAGFRPDKVLYRSIPEIDGYVKETAYCQKGWNNKMYVAPNLMPHQIRITNVRIQHLQDISEDDCLAEGVYKGQCGSIDTHLMDAYYYRGNIQPYCTPREAYAALIDKVSGKGTWEHNPWVFVYEFELVK